MDKHLVVGNGEVKHPGLTLGQLAAVQSRLEQVEHLGIVPVEGEPQLMDAVADQNGRGRRAVKLGALAQLPRLVQGLHQRDDGLPLGLVRFADLHGLARLGVHHLQAHNGNALVLVGGLQQVAVRGHEPLAAIAFHGGGHRALHHLEGHLVREGVAHHHPLDIGQLAAHQLVDLPGPQGHQVIPHLDLRGVNDLLGGVVGVALYLHLIDAEEDDTGGDNGCYHCHQRDQFIEKPKPASAPGAPGVLPLTCHAKSPLW